MDLERYIRKLDTAVASGNGLAEWGDWRLDWGEGENYFHLITSFMV